MGRTSSWWPACWTCLPPWTRTICAPGGNPDGQSDFSTLSLCGGCAVCSLRVHGLRRYDAREAARHDPLWNLLLCALCGGGNCAELADVFYCAIAFRNFPNLSGIVSALPDGSVEAVRAVVAFRMVEADGVGVGFGDGEGDLGDALAQEAGGDQGKQHAGQASAAELGMDAELGDVAALRADARAQHQGHQLAACAIQDHVRDLRGESAATGEADDVVEKAH